MNDIIIRTKISSPECIKNLVLYIAPEDVDIYKKTYDLKKIETKIKDILIKNDE